MDKVVITVVGKDTIGILAKTCTYLAENGINILDISQTVVQDYFNMMMIVDMSGASRPFGDIAEGLAKVGESLGLQAKCQKEEIFEKIWDTTFVGDVTLNVHIRHLREKIEDDAGDPKFIKTVWGVGFMLDTKGNA